MCIKRKRKKNDAETTIIIIDTVHAQCMLCTNLD